MNGYTLLQPDTDMPVRRLTLTATFAFIILLTAAADLSAELRFNGSARSLFYSRESFPGAFSGDTDDSFRYYQSFGLHMVDKSTVGEIGFHTFFRVRDDLSLDLTDDPESRLYNGYLEWKRKNSSLALGRQWITMGPSSLTLDGFKASRTFGGQVEVTGYLGVQTPYSRHFSLQGWDRAKSGGLHVRTRNLKNASFGFGFQQKSYKGKTTFRELGVDGKLDLPAGLDILGRLDFDLLDAGVQRAVLTGRKRVSGRLSLMGEYRHYQPRLIDKSYFKRFDLEGNEQIRGGVSYTLRPGVSLDASYTGVFFEDENDSYITLGAACPYGSFSYFHGTGASGDEDGFAVSGSYLFAGSWELFADIDYSLYRFYEELDRDYVFSSAFGLNWRPNRTVLAGIELQDMNNDFISRDFRVLLKFTLNYSQIF